MTIRRLGAPALEVLHLNCSWSFPDGWRMDVITRPSGMATFTREEYHALGASELFDVGCIQLEQLL